MLTYRVVTPNPEGKREMKSYCSRMKDRYPPPLPLHTHTQHTHACTCKHTHTHTHTHNNLRGGCICVNNVHVSTCSTWCPKDGCNGCILTCIHCATPRTVTQIKLTFMLFWSNITIYPAYIMAPKLLFLIKGSKSQSAAFSCILFFSDHCSFSLSTTSIPTAVLQLLFSSCQK